MLFRGQTLGKYRIAAPLGSGGFGAVYLARDTLIDKDVAIKVPHRQNMNFGELLREPRLLAALDHPNIVSVTTAEKQDNVFFIVMEYVAGHTLEEVIANSGGLDAAHTVYYATQIGRAIEHAHAQGVIHRDSAPGQHARIRVGSAEGRRLRHLALSGDRRARNDRDRQSALHGPPSSSRARRCSRRTSIRSASRCTRC